MAANSDPSIYLLACTDPGAVGAELGDDADVVELRPGLALVETTLGRSRLYHRAKRVQPDGASLLVAPLDRPPKFMGMAEGSTAWIRHRMPAR